MPSTFGIRALEDVELRERVLADREQEVDAQVGAVDDRGKLDGERAGAVLVRVVEEVLLGLVEDHVDVAVEQRAPHPQRLDERARPRRAARASRRARCVTASATRAAKRLQRVVAPRVEDDDREPRLAALVEVRRRDAAQVVGDARPQDRALADAGLAVEDRQPGRHQVRLDQLALALAPEEEADVELGVLERRQPLVRARACRRRSPADLRGDAAPASAVDVVVERHVERSRCRARARAPARASSSSRPTAHER